MEEGKSDERISEKVFSYLYSNRAFLKFKIKLKIKRNFLDIEIQLVNLL